MRRRDNYHPDCNLCSWDAATLTITYINPVCPWHSGIGLDDEEEW